MPRKQLRNGTAVTAAERNSQNPVSRSWHNIGWRIFCGEPSQQKEHVLHTYQFPFLHPEQLLPRCGMQLFECFEDNEYQLGLCFLLEEIQPYEEALKPFSSRGESWFL